MSATAQHVFTIAQMKEWEDTHNAGGLSYAQMMEHAGSRAAADLLGRFDAPQTALVLCGRGNNGGDGLVMARVLAEYGWNVSVVLLQGRGLSPLAAANLQALPCGVNISDGALSDDFKKYQVVIDAVYGTGFRSELPEKVAACFDTVAAAGNLFKVALDLPSGIHGDTAEIAEHTLYADITYTFQALKPAHLNQAVRIYCGEVVCVDLC